MDLLKDLQKFKERGHHKINNGGRTVHFSNTAGSVEALSSFGNLVLPDPFAVEV